MIPPEPTRMVEVLLAMWPMTTGVAALDAKAVP
jgi:hypothetical protein